MIDKLEALACKVEVTAALLELFRDAYGYPNEKSVRLLTDSDLHLIEVNLGTIFRMTKEIDEDLSAIIEDVHSSPQ